MVVGVVGDKMNSNYPRLRNILYEILTAGVDSEPSDITALQNMGVSLSPAVNKQGTNIIQIQSVVNNKVITKVTEALKLLDIIDAQAEPELVLEAEIPSSIPNIREFIEERLEREMSLTGFLRFMEVLYIMIAIETLGETETKRVLRVREQRIAAAKAQKGTVENVSSQTRGALLSRAWASQESG